MEVPQSRAQLQDDFLFKLNVYSHCIEPYLRNIQEKYIASYYYVESEKLDLTTYCKKERVNVENAKTSLERSLGL
jgi:hypothetical protein